MVFGVVSEGFTPCFPLFSSLDYHSNMISDAVKKVIKGGKVSEGQWAGLGSPSLAALLPTAGIWAHFPFPAGILTALPFPAGILVALLFPAQIQADLPFPAGICASLLFSARILAPLLFPAGIWAALLFPAGIWADFPFPSWNSASSPLSPATFPAPQLCPAPDPVLAREGLLAGLGDPPWPCPGLGPGRALERDISQPHPHPRSWQGS